MNKPPAEGVDLLDLAPTPGTPEDGHDCVVVGLAEDESHAGDQRVRELLRRDVAAPQPGDLERDRGEPVDEGAVEVEERAGRRALGTPVDLVDERVHQASERNRIT